MHHSSSSSSTNKSTRRHHPSSSLFSEVCQHINLQNQVEKIVHEFMSQKETIINTQSRMQQDEFVIAHLNQDSNNNNNNNNSSSSRNEGIWTCSLGGLMIKRNDTDQYRNELKQQLDPYQSIIGQCQSKMDNLKQELHALDPNDQFQLRHLIQ